LATPARTKEKGSGGRKGEERRKTHLACTWKKKARIPTEEGRRETTRRSDIQEQVVRSGGGKRRSYYCRGKEGVSKRGEEKMADSISHPATKFKKKKKRSGLINHFPKKRGIAAVNLLIKKKVRPPTSKWTDPERKK